VNRSIRTVALTILGLASGRVVPALAQANPAATQSLRLSAFGGVTGTYTGLNGGKNLGITAGADLEFRPLFTLYPSIEVRGTYPIDRGTIDSQKNILGGLKVARPIFGGRFQPYADMLFGRGQINYGPGYAVPNSPIYYTQSVSNVLSPGIGLDFRVPIDFHSRGMPNCSDTLRP